MESFQELQPPPPPLLPSLIIKIVPFAFAYTGLRRAVYLVALMSAINATLALAIYTFYGVNCGVKGTNHANDR